MVDTWIKITIDKLIAWNCCIISSWPSCSLMFIDIANKKKHNSPCYSESWTSVLNSACLAASHRWETPASHCNYKVPSFDRTNARFWSVYIVDLKMERNPHVSRWNPCRKFENYRFQGAKRRPPLHSLIAVANAGLSAPCGHSAIPRCKQLEGSPEPAHTASCRLYCIPTQMLHVGSKIVFWLSKESKYAWHVERLVLMLFDSARKCYREPHLDCWKTVLLLSDFSQINPVTTVFLQSMNLYIKHKL